MKTFLLTIIIFNIYNLNTFAKHKFNSKIERISYVDCGRCETNVWCGTMGGCKMVYIYKFPKNIDKMIKENPEFKEEILSGEDGDSGVEVSHASGKMYPSIKDYNKKITIKSCYGLWKNDHLDLSGDTTVAIKSLMILEQECNKIVKKILKKTGKLY